MKIEKSHTEVLNIAFKNYLESFLFSVNYYKNLHDPEFRFKHGISIESKYKNAVEQYEKAKLEVRVNETLVKKGETELTIKSYKFLEAIKQGIREQMRMAYYYSENKYLVIRSYKNAIKLLQILNLNTDKYKEVTARYFLHYN